MNTLGLNTHDVDQNPIKLYKRTDKASNQVLNQCKKEDSCHKNIGSPS